MLTTQGPGEADCRDHQRNCNGRLSGNASPVDATGKQHLADLRVAQPGPGRTTITRLYFLLFMCETRM